MQLKVVHFEDLLGVSLGAHYELARGVVLLHSQGAAP